MATILGRRTVDTVLILAVNTDPNLAGGTDAPLGSIAITANLFGLYQKLGGGVTDWVKMVTNGGVDVPVDLGGGNFIFNATRYKQALIELAAGTNYVNIDNIQPGDTYIFELLTGSNADEVFIIDSTFLFPTVVPSANTTGGGQYIPTASAGALDRVLVTCDGVNVYVAPIGQDFIS